MQITKQRGDYLSDIDVLVRAYDNQLGTDNEKELFVGEVLFKPHMNREHERFTAPFPRGIVEGIIGVLKTINGKAKVQVSNEIPDTVGHLTSCAFHFDERFKQGESLHLTAGDIANG